jgi:hypothetical protein
VLQIAGAILKVTQRIVRGTLRSVAVVVEPRFTSRFARAGSVDVTDGVTLLVSKRVKSSNQQLVSSIDVDDGGAAKTQAKYWSSDVKIGRVGLSVHNFTIMLVVVDEGSAAGSCMVARIGKCDEPVRLPTSMCVTQCSMSKGTSR